MSARRGLRLAVVLATALVLAACGGEPRRTAAATYVVRPGDTLYSISWRHGLDYHDVARWNGLGGDYRIAVGQVLVLQRGVRTPVAATAPRPAAPPRSLPPLPAPLPASPPPHWVWPADGVVAGTVAQPSGGVGLRIEGSRGSPVRAAAPGRVVYTGAGLRAYGELIIIKHDETWLSAYGYNQAVLVSEGDLVREGQPIASMGEGPGSRPMLYFEIRMGGRSVDPTTLLPPRG